MANFPQSIRGLIGRVSNSLGFTGRDDYYINQALIGLDIHDALQSYFDDRSREIAVKRLSRYREGWKFYAGDQYVQLYEDGDRKLVMNYCKAIVDKGASWLFPDPEWQIEVPSGNEFAAEFLQAVWRANDKGSLSWKMAQMGGVTGDVFLQVTLHDVDEKGTLLPLDQRQIALRLISSSFCHPVFGPNGEIVECLIQYPMATNLVEANRQKYSLYTQYINRDVVREWINRTELPSSGRKNIFGMVPIVHWCNHPVATSFYGGSDIEDIIPLQEALNSVATAIKKIIEYHAEPTTLIFGAKATELLKGAKKVWSNLPEKARVENLQLNTDLAAAREYMAKIKLAIHEISSIPENAFGEIQPVSNTSGVALETLYLPFTEKVRKKQILYGEGMSKVNSLIILAAERGLGIDFHGLVENYEDRYLNDIVFSSPLPRDESDILDRLQKKITMGIESQLGALKTIYRGKNINAKILEVLADKRENLLTEFEKAKALVGVNPNVAVIGTGSLALEGDYAEVIKDDKAAEVSAAKKKAELTTQGMPTFPNQPPAPPAQ